MRTDKQRAYALAYYHKNKEQIKLTPSYQRRHSKEFYVAQYAKIKGGEKQKEKNDYRRERYKNNEEWRNRRKQAAKESRRQVRAEIIKAYGGKCLCCGEDTPEFLVVDHINGRDKVPLGQGNNRLGGLMYAWLKRNNYPKDNYRLLCSNCNNARAWFGCCPHEQLRLAENKCA